LLKSYIEKIWLFENATNDFQKLFCKEFSFEKIVGNSRGIDTLLIKYHKPCNEDYDNTIISFSLFPNFYICTK